MVTTAFPFRIPPLSNISPFSYRDGATYLEILYALRDYINLSLRPEFDTEMQSMFDQFQAGIANAEATITAQEGDWTTRFNAFMADVNAALAPLNDAVMGTLINDPASATGAALQALYAKVTDVAALTDLTGTGRLSAAALAAGYVARTGSTDLYVNPVTGDDGRDGAGTGTAVRTVAEAIRRAQTAAQTAAAVYTIHLAAGTYTERVVLATLTAFTANILIKGPDVGGHPNIPVAVWDEGAGTSASAFITQNPNLTLTFQDIKFRNYNGTASSQAINSSAGNLYTINVHVQNCFYGISSIKGNLDMKGGILDNCGRLPDGSGTGAAVRSLMLNQHSLGTQNAGVLTLGPVFTNNRYGVLAQENSTGHLDFCTFTDNESAVVLRISSRANIDGASFARNATDVLADGNSDVYVSDKVVFATGVDKSQQRVNALSGSQVTTSTRVVAGVEMARSRSSYVVAGNYADQVFTGLTTDRTVMTQTLKGQWFDNTLRTIGDACQKVKVRMTGDITGTAGTKKVGVTFGGVSSDIFWGAADTGSFIYEAEVMFTAPGQQLLASKASLHLSTVNRNTVTRLTADTTQDIIVKAHVLNSDATDTVTIHSVEFEVS